MNPFTEYAGHYDLLYHDKDYPGEARFVAGLLERHLDKPVAQTEILDVACGTGRHVRELAALGYRVAGSDVSADMVVVARDYAADAKQSIAFYNEAFQTCDRIGGSFDAVIAMFSAIDYLTTQAEIARSLVNIRSLFRDDGLFVFDCWNGNAVVKTYSPVRVKRVDRGDESVIRISTTTLDALAQAASIHFVFILLKGAMVMREFSEVHLVRYFFPQEMTDLLGANGFEVVQRCPFMQADREIGPDDWNVTYVARPFAREHRVNRVMAAA